MFCKNHDELLRKVKEYFETCKKQPRMPYTQELAIELYVDGDTLNEWTKYKGHEFDQQNREYSAIIKKMKTLQNSVYYNALLENLMWQVQFFF